LRQRGSITVWFTDEAVAAWAAPRRPTRGGQPSYSPLAILTALTLRTMFRLAYRQAEELIGSIISLLGLNAVRAGSHHPKPPFCDAGGAAAAADARRVHLLVDSPGLKLCGAGEWLVEKHGTKTRRSWRKLHLGVDVALHDSEIEGRNRTEVAFEHLQRRIAVDGEEREKWKGAFAQNEPACERFGAVHLLSHGICAFKVSSIDSATDLAFNEPFDDRSQIIRRSARAIVLTEGKLVKDTNETVKKAPEARKQTLEYARGVLGDAELKGTRYIVLVSKRQLTPVMDVEANGVRFRHINIAVDPLIPSGAARVSAA
jgi:hypothetical protein